MKSSATFSAPNSGSLDGVADAKTVETNERASYAWLTKLSPRATWRRPARVLRSWILRYA